MGVQSKSGVTVYLFQKRDVIYNNSVLSSAVLQIVLKMFFNDKFFQNYQSQCIVKEIDEIVTFQF